MKTREFRRKMKRVPVAAQLTDLFDRQTAPGKQLCGMQQTHADKILIRRLAETFTETDVESRQTHAEFRRKSFHAERLLEIPLQTAADRIYLRRNRIGAMKFGKKIQQFKHDPGKPTARTWIMETAESIPQPVEQIIPESLLHPHRQDVVETQLMNQFRQQKSDGDNPRFPAVFPGEIEQIVIAVRMKNAEVAGLRNVCGISAPDHELAFIDIFHRIEM